MKNLKELSKDSLSEVKALAFDLDDTLSKFPDGVPAHIFASLETLQKKGFKILMVTGRPAGWADMIARMLPFDGVVAENGSVLYFWPEGRFKREETQAMSRLFWNQKEKNFSKTFNDESRELKANVQKKILKALPQAQVASDQSFRLFDLAIDFAEEVHPPLGLDKAFEIQKYFEEEGATAKVSSIHVNGWWGDFSKRQGLFHLCQNFYNLDPIKELLYVGDSPNDASLFEGLDFSVGVANLKKYVGKVPFEEPSYITEADGPDGVAEVFKKFEV